MIKFTPYGGDTGDLRRNENYLVFKWNNSDCKILFSVTQHGKAANCHFSSDKAGLRKLRDAINEWCEFVFWLFDWCEMISGVIERRSVRKVAESCGFERIKGYNLHIRRRKWAA